MGSQQRVQGQCALIVERVVGLVEQPDARPSACQRQPRERGAAALALAQAAHRRMLQRSHAELLQRGGDRVGTHLVTLHAGQKQQRFGHAEIVFQRIGVGHVDAAGSPEIGRLPQRAAVDLQVAVRRRTQAGQQTQQACLAAAVAAAQPDDAARRQCEVQPREQQPLAARQRQR
jgi:hypothetical protein